MISILSLAFYELRVAMRAMLKNFVFVIATVLMLGLGTGVNAALFGILNSVIFQPLPAKDPGQLVTLSQQASGGESVLDLQDLRRDNHSFQQIEGYIFFGFSFRGQTSTELVTGAQVTPEYLSMIGIPPLFGRTFGAEEEQGQQDHTVVLSEALWKGRLGGNPSAIGSVINLNGEPYTVLGVMPQSVRLPYDNTELWIPVQNNAPWKQKRGVHALRVLGRLKPNVTLNDAQSDISLLTSRLAELYPKEDGGRSVTLVRYQDFLVSNIRNKLYLLGFAVFFIFLITAANVSSLSLTRASQRLRDVAIQTALGASRARLIFQLSVENLLLAVMGSAVGWLLATWWVHLIVALKPAALPRIHEIHLDYRVLLLLIVFAFVIAAALALVNIYQFDRLKLNETLGSSGRNPTVFYYRRWLRNGLVGLEVSMAVLLLIGTGLLIRSFQKIYSVDFGFDPQNRATLHLSLPIPLHDRSAAEIYEPIYEKVKALPGVAAVGIANVLPLQNSFDTEYFIEGRTPAGSHNSCEVRTVNESYFNALSMTMISGRQFTARDNETSPRVAIINQKMAKHWFGNESPLGQRMRALGTQDWMTIVGVVSDMHDASIEAEASAEFYMPYRQNTFPPAMWNVGMVVRTSTLPTSALPEIKQAIGSVNPEITLWAAEPMEEVISDSLRDRRLAMTLLAIFAGLALALATYGLYAVLSYSVLLRTREIGVRMAMGATRGRILYYFTLQGMRIVIVSLAIGTIAAFALSRIMATLLFGIKATDPITFIGANVVLLITAFFAIVLPAWRGARLEPHDALRFE